MTATVASALTALPRTWFSEVLGLPVATAEIEAVAFTGATTDMARIRLTYENGADGPASLVAKITGGGEIPKAMDAAMGLFAREGHFYREFAAQVPVRTARCYHVGDGDTTPLLLEDLADLRMGDQMDGLQVEDAERIIDVLSALHARFWEAPELAQGWLVDPAAGAYGALVAQLVGSGAGAIQEHFAGRGSDAVLAAVAEYAPKWDVVLQRGVEGPKTLVHNDARLDNVFFADDGEPLLIDWQACARTRGTQDVANLLAQSMDVALLTPSWEPLLRRYHAGLVEHGVSGYSWEQCLLHYRQNVPYALGAGMALMGAMDIGDGRGLGEAIVTRALSHIGELDSFSAIAGS
jgi:hypothetical protein